MAPAPRAARRGALPSNPKTADQIIFPPATKKRRPKPPFVSVMIWWPHAAAARRARASMAMTAICRNRSSWRSWSGPARGHPRCCARTARAGPTPGWSAVPVWLVEVVSISRSEAKANVKRPLELDLLDGNPPPPSAPDSPTSPFCCRRPCDSAVLTSAQGLALDRVWGNRPPCPLGRNQWPARGISSDNWITTASNGSCEMTSVV